LPKGALGGLQQPIHPRPSVCAELLPPVIINININIIIILFIPDGKYNAIFISNYFSTYRAVAVMDLR